MIFLNFSLFTEYLFSVEEYHSVAVARGLALLKSLLECAPYRGVLRQVVNGAVAVPSEHAPAVAELLSLLASDYIEIVHEPEYVAVFGQELPVPVIEQPRAAYERHGLAVLAAEKLIRLLIRIYSLFIRQRSRRGNMEIIDLISALQDNAALLIVIGVKARLFELESAEPEAGHIEEASVPTGDERAPNALALLALEELPVHILNALPKNLLVYTLFGIAFAQRGARADEQAHIHCILIFAELFAERLEPFEHAVEVLGMGDELIDKGVEIPIFRHSFGAIANSVYSLLREADMFHYVSALVCAD